MTIFSIVLITLARLFSNYFCGRQVLVLGLIWQIIRIQLTAAVSLPDPMKCSLDPEDKEASSTWTPEQILLGWINYNLELGAHEERVTNFASDFKVFILFLELKTRLTFIHRNGHVRIPQSLEKFYFNFAILRLLQLRWLALRLTRKLRLSLG